jgi:uncharacterized damage-inducible protein DinB
MKKYLLIIALFTCAIALSQPLSAKDAFLEKWRNSKAYMLAVAEAMPEAAYNFKPTERQMSFKEQLLHIKRNMDWLGTSYFSVEVFIREKSPLPETKAETIALLSAAFDTVLERVTNTSEEDLKTTVDFFAGPKSKLQILNLLQDHVTHHRGQLVVYLNLKNAEPPQYIGW